MVKGEYVLRSISGSLKVNGDCEDKAVTTQYLFDGSTIEGLSI